MRLWPIMACLLLSFGIVGAVTYSDVTLNAPSSDTNITFDTYPVDCDSVEINASYITLQDCSITTGSDSVTTVLMNFTTANTTTDSVLFPRFTSSTANTRTVVNDLPFAVNVSFNISTGTLIPSAPSITLPDGTSSSLSYTSTGGFLNTSPVEIPPGTSILELRGGYGEFIPADAVCNSGMNRMERGFLFMGVIGAFVVGIFLVLMNGITPTLILLLSIAIVMMGVALNAICW